MLICNLSSENGSCAPAVLFTVIERDKSGFSRVENTFSHLPHCLRRHTEGVFRLGRLIPTDVSDPQKGHFINILKVYRNMYTYVHHAGKKSVENSLEK